VKRFSLLLLLALAITAVLAGCTRKSKDEPGVVARVNGRPIQLELLEFQYDLLHFESLSGALPTVGALRDAYGDILGSLVAQELVAQELEKRGQDVTDEELAEAEAKVRADYPDDTFDQMLADEFIDLKMWRKQLRYSCGIEKFLRLVMRPSIHLDYREAEAYYREHMAEFRLPDRVRLLVVRSGQRDQVEKVLAHYRQHKDVRALAEAVPGAQAREIVVPSTMLTPAWADALHGSGSGQGAILSGRAGYEGLVLLERLPAQTLDIEQAYPQVEAALVERKLQEAFETWLMKAVDGSVILVSERLLHKMDNEDLPPEAADQPDENATQPDVASGNETG
jgi:hypothetical protein